MSIQRIERTEVAARAVDILGLDEDTVELFSAEALSASVRRAASFLCPASPRQIIDSVLDALTPLKRDLERDVLADMLDALVGVGDLLELRQAGSRTRQVFLGPPSYVERQPGEYLLLGVRPHADTLIDERSLGAEILYEAHTRSIVLEHTVAAKVLRAAGLHRLTREQWAKVPRQEAASGVIEQVRDRLGGMRAPGQVTGLTVIGGAASVRFYKGRWREPTTADSGIFVGRRPQAYGAPIWCAVEFAAGMPEAVLDLPVDSTVAPGWDEARRIQAALDAERGTPQVYRVRVSGQPDDAVRLDFFGPLPSWAERRLALTGLPVARSKGSLFSYRVPGAAVNDIEAFLSATLWMTAIEEEQRV